MDSNTAHVTPERIMQFAWGYPDLSMRALLRHRDHHRSSLRQSRSRNE